MDFIKGTAVCNPQNNIPDVVRFVWMFRYQTVQFGSFIRIGFSGRLEGYLLFTILRKIREKFSDLQKASCIRSEERRVGKEWRGRWWKDTGKGREVRIGCESVR